MNAVIVQEISGYSMQIVIRLVDAAVAAIPLFAGAWLASRLLPRLPSGARAALWWLACLKLMVGLFWLSPISIPVLPQTASTMTQTAGTASLPPAESAAAPAPEAAPAASVLSVEILWIAVLVSWAGVVFVRLAILARHFRAARRAVAHALSTEDQRVLVAMAQVAHALSMRSVPMVCVSNSDTDPVLIGILRPRIVLSGRDIARLGDSELRMLLAHEAGHIRRGDLLLALVPALAQALFFWNPLVWVACREFDLARESACDALAIRTVQARPDMYGRLLLDLGTRRESLFPAGALGAAPHFRTLQRRIAMLQNVSAPSRWVSVGMCFILIVGLTALVPFRLTAAADSAAGAHSPAQVASLYSNLIDAVKQADYNRFIADGTPAFKSITRAKFAAACTELSPPLKGSYTTEYLGSKPLDGRQVYDWKLAMSDGANWDATLTVFHGLVDGFWMKPMLNIGATPPPAAAKLYDNIISAVAARDYPRSIKDGTPAFRTGITPTVFNSVCDQLSAKLNGPYKNTYIGNTSAQGRQVYEWQMAFSDGTTVKATLAVYNGLVDGFFLSPA